MCSAARHGHHDRPTPTPIACARLTVNAEETVAPTAAVRLATLTEPVAMAATATPEVILYLERKDGIRLVADETQLFIQRPYHGDQKILAILGNSEAAINSGVTRLLNRDLAGCLAQEELIICPYSPVARVRPQGPAEQCPAAHRHRRLPQLRPAGTPSPDRQAKGKKCCWWTTTRAPGRRNAAKQLSI